MSIIHVRRMKRHAIAAAILVLAIGAALPSSGLAQTPAEQACMALGSSFADCHACAGNGLPVNDPRCVHIRSIYIHHHPETAAENALAHECDGIKVYDDPQPPGHPATLAQCDQYTRRLQQKFGLPVTGLGDEQIRDYRQTWGPK